MAGHDKITPEGKAFYKQIEELQKNQVRVGFQHGEETDEETGADLADIAMWNELGTEYIPARPFLRQSVDDNAERISSACKSQLRAIVRGEKTAKDVLQTLGVMQKGLIQKTIKSGGFEPNAPRTVKKKTKGKGGKTTPLIDTGRMRQSVNFVIKPKGGD